MFSPLKPTNKKQPIPEVEARRDPDASRIKSKGTPTCPKDRDPREFRVLRVRDCFTSYSAVRVPGLGLRNSGDEIKHASNNTPVQLANCFAAVTADLPLTMVHPYSTTLHYTILYLTMLHYISYYMILCEPARGPALRCFCTPT